MNGKMLGKCICRECHGEFEVETLNSVNAVKQPQAKERLLGGEMFLACCPHCGTSNLLRFPLLYSDPEQRLLIWLTDPDAEAVHRARALFESDPQFSGYICRLVYDAGVLIEKVKIFDAGLDDVVMELCKYVTAQELGLDPDGMRFLQMEGADGLITLAYPKDGRMEMVRTGFNVYEDCRGIVARNPEIERLSKGLCCIDARWIAALMQ